MNRSLALVLALAGCDEIYGLNRPPVDASSDGGITDVIDGPTGCSWATAGPIIAVPAKGTAIAAGRFDLNDSFDLAVGSDGSTFLNVYYSDNSGFGTLTTFDAVQSIYALAAGDIDHVDPDDLAVGGATTAAAMLSTGTNWDRRAVTVAGRPSSIAIANLDSDGLTDMVVTIPSGDVASVVIGNASAYTVSQSIPTLQDPMAVAIGNYDGDSDLDLAVALLGDGSVSLHRDNGSNFDTGPVISTSTTPIAIALARLGTNQVLDIVVANRASNNVTILRNSGTGVFTPTETLGVGQEPVALAVADIDADGRADIIVVNRKSNSIAIVRGTDTGFETASMHPTVDKPNALAIADFTGDSHLDIAVLGDAGFVVHPAVCQ